MTRTERPVGRPRSEEARVAVLRAVDDMLVEQGYAAMTMKGIAERAGVGRQTVYRWWSTKAEILLEASAADAVRELAVDPQPTPLADIECFLAAVVRFLTVSDAGLAYRALIGEAQHDAAVAALIAGADPLGDAAEAVIARVQDAGALPAAMDRRRAAAELVGPVVYRVLAQGWRGDAAEIRLLAGRFLRG
ncbi:MULTISPECIES: TetR/AcrR family transcriptional regulator [Tsukamurella]|uniref:TetR/AcrR family transcriptional regulator n=1 Tax=Tsukamurella strandjordii TaxID=147577 RepID=A0AA90NAW2_9ACTN|nr:MULTISPECIES: TetR/AcrR family transcriptional regulator [Tsukamurella]MDP0398881.1 TetR/AcrR family transcriptional regulator [Tsukamurella strandjordii]GIZ99342.1 putative transcriptional regulator, TetR family protein [Tsukamurella sp. TY48]